MLNISNGEKNYRILFKYSHKGKNKKLKWITECFVIDRDTKEEVSHSATKYNAQEDQFDKALGRRIALSLAILDVFDREFRAKIWDTYKNMISEKERRVFQ